MFIKPGTYDVLSHMFFDTPPTAGSSGGPIVDEDTGAVVGVILGSRMDSQLEGMRGWGVPSEAIFEVRVSPNIPIALLSPEWQMFSLPGLELNRNK